MNGLNIPMKKDIFLINIIKVRSKNTMFFNRTLSCYLKFNVLQPLRD